MNADQNRFLAAAFCLLLAALSAVTSSFADVPPLEYDHRLPRRTFILGMDRQGFVYAMPDSICVREGQALRLVADVAVAVRPGTPRPPAELRVPGTHFWRRIVLDVDKFRFRLSGARGYETWVPTQVQRVRGHFRKGQGHRNLVLLSVPSYLGSHGALEVTANHHPSSRYRLINVDRNSSACTWAHPNVYEPGFAQ